MQSLDHLSAELAERHLAGESWRILGRRLGIHGSMARLIANGYNPGKRIRQKLDLPQSVKVVVVQGNHIPDGTQVIHARQCNCGQWYVPNHPRRAKCFICSPYRGRKGSAQ